MMLTNSSPASTPSQLELSIPLCSSKNPTLGGSGGAVQERLVRRLGPRPNYTNLVHERLHYRLGSQVYTHLKDYSEHTLTSQYQLQPGQLCRYSGGLAGRRWIPGEGARFLSSPKHRLWGAPSLLHNGTGGSFPGGKWPEREAECRDQEWRSYTSTRRYAFMAWCLTIKHRDFTLFTFLPQHLLFKRDYSERIKVA
jgi:hypothetical protein